MVIKVYISGISGNKEVKKRQQRVVMILESKNIQYVAIDIAEPGRENDKEFMQQNSETKDSKHPLPPQIFNDEEYCGDYEGFDLANELDELEKFLKVPVGSIASKESQFLSETHKSQFTNGSVTSSREQSTEKESAEQETITSLSEDRVSGVHGDETQQDDLTKECKSPINESEETHTTEDGEEEEEEETTTHNERSTVNDKTNDESIDNAVAEDDDDDDDEDDEDDDEEENDNTDKK